jgi:hypothetical protein
VNPGDPPQTLTLEPIGIVRSRHATKAEAQLAAGAPDRRWAGQRARWPLRR